MPYRGVLLHSAYCRAEGSGVLIREVGVREDLQAVRIPARRAPVLHSTSFNTPQQHTPSRHRRRFRRGEGLQRPSCLGHQSPHSPRFLQRQLASPPRRDERYHHPQARGFLRLFVQQKERRTGAVCQHGPEHLDFSYVGNIGLMPLVPQRKFGLGGSPS